MTLAKAQISRSKKELGDCHTGREEREDCRLCREGKEMPHTVYTKTQRECDRNNHRGVCRGAAPPPRAGPSEDGLEGDLRAGVGTPWFESGEADRGGHRGSSGEIRRGLRRGFHRRGIGDRGAETRRADKSRVLAPP